MSHRHSIFCILPPYMLDQIAQNGTSAQREMAIRTLVNSQQLRDKRLTMTATVMRAAYAVTGTKKRTVYDAKFGTNLPGTIVRTEGDAAVADVTVNEAYDGSGATYDLYSIVYGRNSIDNNGMNLNSTVHYDKGYDNAFWDGKQMVYGDGDDPLQASLVAYALVKAGHLRVSMLDGGYAAWQGAEPASQDFPTLKPTSWTSTLPAAFATLEDVRTAMRTEETALVDARPAKFFRGETRGWKRNGHIRGATSFDWHQLVHADNEALIRPVKEINAQLTAAGLDASDDTIVYCGTGREATLLYLYLKGVARWPRVRLYEGSWTEYQSDASLPVARGAASSVRIVSDGEVSLSGQPDAESLAMLAERGVKLIINCRSKGEIRSNEFNERAAATAAGLTYVEIPLGGSDGYSPEDVEQLAKVMTAHPEPGRVHIHCAGGPRAATLWAAYLVKHRSMAPAAAMERIRATGIMRETGFERLLDQTLLPQPPAASGT